jgi:hypothetical protein
MKYWWTYKVELPYYNFKHFFINTWKLRKELSEARPYDWTGVLSLMQGQLKMMEESQRLHSQHLYCQDRAKEIRVCIHLLERIINDDYLKLNYKVAEGKSIFQGKWEFKHDLPKSVKYCIKQQHILKKQDMELLTNILRRSLFDWWS